MTFESLPWLLLGATILILVGALIALLASDRDLDTVQAENQRLLQQQRIDQADLHAARKDYHRVREERDRARATVRNLLEIQRQAGLRLSRTQPMQQPPALDDSLTEEFTRVVERNTWPQWPDNGGQS